MRRARPGVRTGIIVGVWLLACAGVGCVGGVEGKIDLGECQGSWGYPLDVIAISSSVNKHFLKLHYRSITHEAAATGQLNVT